MIERCAICREHIELVQYVGKPLQYQHIGGDHHDHGAVRMRQEESYQPYDPSEQTNGPVPTLDDLMEVGIGNEIRSTPEDVKITHGSGNIWEDLQVENPYASTTEDYKEDHGDGKNRHRLFLVYLAAIVLVLVVATATFGLLHATPWAQSWWTCLAVTILFKMAVTFGRWRFIPK